jgi:hypothetical protein
LFDFFDDLFIGGDVGESEQHQPQSRQLTKRAGWLKKKSYRIINIELCVKAFNFRIEF